MINRCAVLFGLCVFLIGCQASIDSTTKPKSPSVKATALAPLTDVKPLNAPGNPYAGKYREWDEWLASHAAAVTAPGTNPTGIIDRDSGSQFSTMLDDQGFIIPWTEYYRLLEESTESDAFRTFDKSRRRMAAVGDMPQDMLQRARAACDAVRASFYRPIPSWLNANPPLEAVLLPNGEIATRGALGSGKLPDNASAQSSAAATPGQAGKTTDCCGGDPKNPGWYRYDKDGKLLGVTKSNFWWNLYVDPEMKEYPAGQLEVRTDGYAIFHSPLTADVTAIYDYDGKKLTAAVPPFRDSHPFHRLRVNLIKTYYAAQQHGAVPSAK